jgi:dTMP kinase
MDSLLNIIQKVQSNKDYFLDSKDLPEKLIHKILKWYDGNVYNKSNERVNNAINILAWCNNNASNLDYLPRNIRDKRFETAAEDFKISHEKLVALFSSYSKVLFPNQKETKIIAFEGIDGSGKTVQMSLFEENLKSSGKQVTIKSFPVYDSFFGKNIGQFLSGNEEIDANNVDPKSMSLWYALDRWKSFENFNYSNYDYLLLNRFTLSSAVYQSARVKQELRSEFVQWIFELEHSQLGLPAPDLYIVFDLNAETSKKNISSKGFRDYVGEKADVYEGSTDIMINARKIYQELAQTYKNIVIINCLDENNQMKTPQEINQIVMKVIEDGQY